MALTLWGGGGHKIDTGKREEHFRTLKMSFIFSYKYANMLTYLFPCKNAYVSMLTCMLENLLKGPVHRGINFRYTNVHNLLGVRAGHTERSEPHRGVSFKFDYIC